MGDQIEELVNEVCMGLKEELEHGTINDVTNITNDDLEMTSKIVFAHLNEDPQYYTKLKSVIGGSTRGSSSIQSILFNKNSYDTDTAEDWLKFHGITPIKEVHITEKYLRYRIQKPIEGMQYRTYRIKKGIKFVLMMPVG